MTQTIAREAEAFMPVAPSAIEPETPARKRPRPGERRIQILQTLAGMLEHPRGEKITTAALAAKLSVSEAALYRHFASKAQMFEGLIGFIEQTVFGLINQITTQEEHGLRQVQAIVRMLLTFAEKNPGMTRVLTGEALVGEHERLQERINQMIDRIEASLGVVSALGGPWRSRSGSMVGGYIRTDTTMFPGFSGGPLVDGRGRVLGMNSSMFRERSLSVPAEAVSSLVALLEQHGRVRRAYLGE